MVPKNDIKFFIRFLKDKGVYNAFKRDLNTSPGGVSYFDFINKKNTRLDAAEIIMYCIVWDTAAYPGWGDLYREFRKKYDSKKRT
jgi:hypothetical protein